MSAALIVVGFVICAVVIVSSGDGRPRISRYVGVTPTTTAAEERAQLLAHVSTAPANGETVLSTNAAVAVQTTSGHLTSVMVEAYPSGARLRGGLNAAGDVWLATGGLLPSTTYQMTYKVDGANGVTAIGFGTFSTWPTPVIQMSEGAGSPSTAAGGPRRPQRRPVVELP